VFDKLTNPAVLFSLVKRAFKIPILGVRYHSFPEKPELEVLQ
jgi:hypothetical protein